MTTWVEQEVSLITTNDPNTGALNVNPGFSSWSFEVANGLTIPHNARNATLECPQAAVWYSSHLIKATGPNTINVEVVIPPTTYNFAIVYPPGLWSLEALNDELNYQIIEQSGSALTGDYFQIEGVTATGKTRVVFSAATNGVKVTLDFTDADTIFDLLGFNQGDLIVNYPGTFPGPPPVWPQSRNSPNQATFDSTGAYNFSTNLCGGVGIPTNSTQGNVLAQILIDVSAGSQIIYRPPITCKVDVDHLIGKTINMASFEITNEKGEEVVFSGEVNSFILLLKWLVPINDASLTGGNWQRRVT